MRIKFITIIFLFILIGCENETINKEKNTINCIDSTDISGGFNRYCEVFYPNGNLMSSYTTKDDSIPQGSFLSYYQNGVLEDSSYYVGGGLFGVRKTFYPNGNKKEVIEYVFLNYDSYRNRYAEYDSITGELLKEESFYYELDLNPKTSKEGDSLIVNFNFVLPKYKDTAYIELGNYDEFFRISKEDKEKTRIVPVINQKAEFKVKVEKRDYYFIRGIIYNFDKADTTKRRLFYFYEKYEVI